MKIDFFRKRSDGTLLKFVQLVVQQHELVESMYVTKSRIKNFESGDEVVAIVEANSLNVTTVNVQMNMKYSGESCVVNQ